MQTLDFLSDLVGRARRAGADAADAWISDGTSISLSWRDGAVEHVERSEGGGVGLRVFVGKRMAIVSSADRREPAVAALIDRAVAMARAVPEDPHCGLADPGEILRDFDAGPLDLVDPEEPSVEVLTERARRAEEAALAVSGVTRSDGASASWGRGGMVLAASNGFVGRFVRTGSSLSAAAIAGTGTGMETEYEHTSAVYAGDLDPAETVGRRAGERAVARLGARKVATARVPVVFDPRVSRSLLGHLAAAISGTAIARGTSFLKDRMGQSVFAAGVTIIDDPLRPRGAASRPFDGEGLPTRRRAIIEDGRLTGWLLDLHSARRLGLPPTGNATRGGGAPSPAPSNFFMMPGTVSPAALIEDIAEGFYVTAMMGSSVDGITGDYSRGASGFWIVNGQIAYPVNEVTVAGNLIEMFRRAVPADDLEFRRTIDAPTIRIDDMIVAGR